MNDNSRKATTPTYGRRTRTPRRSHISVSSSTTDAVSIAAYKQHASPLRWAHSESAASCSQQVANKYAQWNAAQPIGRRLNMRPQTLTCDQTAVRSLGLQFNGLYPRNYTDYSFTNPEWTKGWVGLVGWPIVDTFTHKLVTCQP